MQRGSLTVCASTHCIDITVIILVRFPRFLSKPIQTEFQPSGMRNSVYYDNGGSLNYPRSPRPEIPSYRQPDVQPPVRLDALPTRPQQPTVTPNLVPVSTTTPPATTITPAPLNYWPDQPGQGQAQPVRNIMDSDI
ncbi:hypothetical protein Y032_0283g1332 [Ancylostoma ceylanicum]|nr:hypothetical protein Y032_0283g1332 [Ancylostoma ceylanicum]